MVHQTIWVQNVWQGNEYENVFGGWSSTYLGQVVHLAVVTLL